MNRDQLIFEELFKDQHYGPRDGFIPRDWQMECVTAYKESIAESAAQQPAEADRQHVFTIYAGTGSGKTKAAALIAAHMLGRRIVEQVVVVSPTRIVRRKTKEEFMRWFGIELVQFNKKRHKDGIPRMQQGYILTYGALMNDPTLHRRLCQNARTLVIFDEIHHLGDKGGWGAGAVEAFQGVAFVVALTGTPYRSENNQIPFVTYEAQPDSELLKFQAKPPTGFTYSLGRAVSEGVCRDPHFRFHNGTCLIRHGVEGSGILKVTFDDHDVTDEIAAARLAGAVRCGSVARRKMLEEALPLCRQQRRKVVVFLGGDTEGEQLPTHDATVMLPDELQALGYTPEDYEIVTSADDDALEKIEGFGAHPTKWVLISIQMVSEGTDIPELSAAIFLTSVTAKQTTVQRIGRVLRLMGEDDPHKDALIFMFRDKNLQLLSKEIKDEIAQEIALRAKRRENSGEQDGEDKRKTRREVSCIAGGDFVSVSFGGHEWAAADFQQAVEQVKQWNYPVHQVHSAAVLLLLNQEKSRHGS